MNINTDIEKIVPPNSLCAEYYKQQGKEQAILDIQNIIELRIKDKEDTMNICKLSFNETCLSCEKRMAQCNELQDLKRVLDFQDAKSTEKGCGKVLLENPNDESTIYQCSETGLCPECEKSTKGVKENEN